MASKREKQLILVADDVLPTTVMLERVFEFEGYDVQSVYDGISAIESAKTLLPDLILLDVNMPGMNGFEVLRRLREDAKTASIPTILITAMGELSDVVQGLNLGADDYLRKPFNSQELLARAKSKIRARKLEESLQHRTRELEVLLRVSEELNQHLEVAELLDFILYLVIDMLPCKIAAIYHLDDDLLVDAFRAQRNDGTLIIPDLDGQELVDQILQHPEPFYWSQNAFIPNYSTGMITPLQYGGELRGILLVASDTETTHYDENDLRLLNGIGRSASLAIRNAELYEIQLNYATHLEDMVHSRTRELESAQQMLIQSEKLASVGRLAASVAHEVKNPLFPIRINLEGMLEDVRAGLNVDEGDIERTLESVDRIKSIVDRLLGFTGNWQVNASDTQAVDVNQIIEDIVQLNQKFFEQENIHVRRELNEVPSIRGQKYQLEHVFMNLALNAKDAMPNGGELTIKSCIEKKKIKVVIEDTGTGIPNNLIDKIFEPFVSTKENGNGLGLFISYGIVEKHHGKIDVKSELGKGTQFTVTFPLPA